MIQNRKKLITARLIKIRIVLDVSYILDGRIMNRNSIVDVEKPVLYSKQEKTAYLFLQNMVLLEWAKKTVSSVQRKLIIEPKYLDHFFGYIIFCLFRYLYLEKRCVVHRTTTSDNYSVFIARGFLILKIVVMNHPVYSAVEKGRMSINLSKKWSKCRYKILCGIKNIIIYRGLRSKMTLAKMTIVNKNQNVLLLLYIIFGR